MGKQWTVLSVETEFSKKLNEILQRLAQIEVTCKCRCSNHTSPRVSTDVPHNQTGLQKAIFEIDTKVKVERKPQRETQRVRNALEVFCATSVTGDAVCSFLQVGDASRSYTLSSLYGVSLVNRPNGVT